MKLTLNFNHSIASVMLAVAVSMAGYAGGYVGIGGHLVRLRHE